MYFFLKLYSWYAHFFPLRVNYHLSIPLGKLVYYCDKAGRTGILTNLGRIVPQARLAARRKIAQKVFVNFQKYLFEYFALKDVSPHALTSTLITLDTRNVETFIKEKKSFVVVSSHLGNWELAGKYGVTLGRRINIIYRPFRDKRVNSLFTRNDRQSNITYIPLGPSLRKAFKALQNGEIVAMVGDWGIGDKHGTEVTFFGAKTYFPSGPASLALKTNSPLVPAFMVRTAANHFEGVMEEPIYPVPGTPEEQQVKEMTQRFARVLEKYVQKYPDQWLIFTPVWQKEKQM